MADRGFLCSSKTTTAGRATTAYEKQSGTVALASARRQPDVLPGVEPRPYVQLDVRLAFPRGVWTIPPMKLRPITSDDGLLGREHPDFPALMQRFEHLVSTHPHPYIREGLLHDIMSGEVIWTMNLDNSGYNGGFGILCRDDGYGRSVCDPQFLINPLLLIDLDTTSDVLDGWSVLYHEYIHYLQWLSSDEEDRELWISWLGQDRPEMTPETCEHHWFAEHEAFWRECEYNAQTGFGFMWQFCNAMGSADLWNQELAEFMTSEVYAEELADCVPVWRELGGLE
ncbi:MAG: hypothetical protein ABIG66_00260 [Candidatus Kerfeldbacteria bacterium]